VIQLAQALQGSKEDIRDIVDFQALFSTIYDLRSSSSAKPDAISRGI
jgi:hypothetical protein